MIKGPLHASRVASITAVTGVFLILLAAIAAPPSAAPTPPFGKWTRLSAGPIMSPSGDGFESAGTFNPAVVEKNGKFEMLYRAQDHAGKSSLGYATSSDGVHFTKRSEPVLASEAPYEKGG